MLQTIRQKLSFGGWMGCLGNVATLPWNCFIYLCIERERDRERFRIHKHSEPLVLYLQPTIVTVSWFPSAVMPHPTAVCLLACLLYISSQQTSEGSSLGSSPASDLTMFNSLGLVIGGLLFQVDPKVIITRGFLRQSFPPTHHWLRVGGPPIAHGLHHN